MYCISSLARVKDRSTWIKSGSATVQRPAWSVEIKCTVPKVICASFGLQGVLSVFLDSVKSTTEAPCPVLHIEEFRVVVAYSPESCFRDGKGRPSFHQLDLDQDFKTVALTPGHCLRFGTTPLPPVLLQQCRGSYSVQIHASFRTADNQVIDFRQEVPTEISNNSRVDWNPMQYCELIGWSDPPPLYRP